MRKTLLLLAIVVLTFTACSKTAADEGALTIEDILKEYQQPSGEGRAPASGGNGILDVPAPSNGATCYGEDQHPIAVSIADQFTTITNYDEIMTWFCKGAQFEDILNALATEEITGIEAEAMLRMVAEGFTWDEIWLELGVTEQ